MRRTTIAAAGAVVVCICLLTGVTLYLTRGAGLVEGRTPEPTSLAINTAAPPGTQAPRLDTGTPQVSATTTLPAGVGTTSPPSGAGSQTLASLMQAQVPLNNPLDLAPRLGHAQTSPFVTPSAPRIYQVGDKATFWVSRDITGTNQLITATLGYVSDHVYMWLEDGLDVKTSELQKGGQDFETKIYPTDRQFLGSEWTPGVDNDPHIYILNTRFRNAAGYYSSSDEYPTSVNRFSNQHEIFYNNTDVIRPGSLSFQSVIAHEFAHMIHWNENRQESSWLKEGLGDLAIRLNNLRTESLEEFQRQPNLQLTGWAADPRETLAHYEAGYLFLSYALDRFGERFLRDVVSATARDTNSVAQALAKSGTGISFDGLFGDWVVANVVNDGRFAGGKYSYKKDRPAISPQTVNRLPFTDRGAVHEYGTVYYELNNAKGDAEIKIQADAIVPVIPTNAHSGAHFWWGNRADLSDTSLTRSLDLSTAKSASLTFWTNYDIEQGFDYAYVAVSNDEGKTWTTLPGKYTTQDNPNGANHGNGITGRSGVTEGDKNAAPQWVQERMDLSAYSGQHILARFEYVTDDEFVGAGIAVDDIEVPEIGWKDDVETAEGDWRSSGFVAIDNQLPQKFLVQVIEYGPDLKVERVALDASNRGSLIVRGLGKEVTRVVVAVSGITPFTWESSNYQLDIRAAGP